MATDGISPPRDEVSWKRLWFGLSGTAICWVALGITDCLITWRECLHQEQYGGASPHPGLHALNIILFLALLATAVLSGIISYRTWRNLSGAPNLIEAEGYGRREYMALVGVLITATVGLGILWLGLPLMILTLCVRTR